METVFPQVRLVPWGTGKPHGVDMLMSSPGQYNHFRLDVISCSHICAGLKEGWCMVSALPGNGRHVVPKA